MGKLRGLVSLNSAIIFLFFTFTIRVQGSDDLSDTEEKLQHLEEKFEHLFEEKNPQLRFGDFFTQDAVLLRPEYPLLKGEDMKKYLKYRLDQDIGRLQMKRIKFEEFGEDVAIQVLYLREYRKDGSERVNGKMLLLWVKNPTDSLWRVKYFVWNRNKPISA